MTKISKTLTMAAFMTMMSAGLASASHEQYFLLYDYANNSKHRTKVLVDHEYCVEYFYLGARAGYQPRLNEKGEVVLNKECLTEKELRNMTE